MGCQPDFFTSWVTAWLDRGWLPSGGRLLDFGAQEFMGDSPLAREQSARFLATRNVPETAIRAALPPAQTPCVARVYEALGIDYTALDVAGDGAAYFDLNTFAPPIAWRAAFDLVNNEGTIEHLANPLNGFQVAHEVLKVGGVAVHSMPLTGWGGHGFFCPTLRFYDALIGANSYELLEAMIFVEEKPFDAGNPRFLLKNERGKPLRNVTRTAECWVRLAYRKTRAAAFRAPADHLPGEPSGLADRLAANLAAYSRKRRSINRDHDPAGDEFERAMELQQREMANARLMQQRDHQLSENLAAILQQRDHEHADTLATALQQREHEHADTLATALQQREHEHADTLADRYGGSVDFGGIAALMLAGPAVGLNGVALFLERQPAFAIGLLAAVAPALVAWTGLAMRGDWLGRFVRRSVKLAWLASVGAFAFGCLR